MCAEALLAIALALAPSDLDAALLHAKSEPLVGTSAAVERLAARKRPATKRRGNKSNNDTRQPALIPELPLEPPPPALPSPPALPAGKQRVVALLPFEATGIDDDLLHAIEGSLLNEIDEKRGYRAVSPRDVQAEISAYGLDATTCAGEARCLATAGRYARAHLAIATRVAAFGGTINVSMRLIDTQSATESGRVAEPLADEPDERAQALHRLTVQLLTPDQYVGGLVIKSPEAGADIYLNDKLVGVTPLKKPLQRLPAGPYILRVSKEGFSDLYQFVDVTYKRSSTITVDLANNTIAGLINPVESATGFGSLFVYSRTPGLEIRVDGEPRGTTFLAAPITQVPAGTRRISMRKEGMEPLIQEIEVVADKRTDVGLGDGPGGMTVVATRVIDAAAALPDRPELIIAQAAQPVDAPRSLPPAPRQDGWLFMGGLAVGGAGGLALIVGGYYGRRVVAYGTEAKELRDALLENSYTSARERQQDREAFTRINETDGPNAQRNHLIALGAGVGLLAIGGGMVLADIYGWLGGGAGEPATDGADGAGGGSALRWGIAPGAGGGQAILELDW